MSASTTKVTITVTVAHELVTPDELHRMVIDALIPVVHVTDDLGIQEVIDVDGRLE